MTTCIDLNSDLGESFGVYKLGNDEQILDYVTSANIACGYHAGDHNVMHRTVKMAAEKNVGLGAHPGLPDLTGFGRRTMAVEPEDVYNLVIYQVGSLQAFARLYQQCLNHVKPHGALYNIAAKDAVIAQAIAKAVYHLDKKLVLFGLAGSALIKVGREMGLTVAEEIFADRTYQADGSLTPRTHPDALIHNPDQAANQVTRIIKEGKVRATDGTDINMRADTVCVHGDTPQAVAFVQKLHSALQKNNIKLQKIMVK